MSTILRQGLEALNLPKEKIPSIQEKLEGYIKELMLFNAAYDLVGSENHGQIVVNHILDSLSAWALIKDLAQERENGRQAVAQIADIGSGGGLPGIPLAIALPQFQFVLVERMSKRCAFLENCAAVLNLRNVRVENLQAEQVEAASFDVATFRAFRPLDKKIIKTLLRTIKSDGILAAYKAKQENITTEMAAISSIVPEYKIEKLVVPFMEDHQRHLVLIQHS
ncbi:MAG: 16S rRNA (guanine(527)-N(7))-methyltransferase RsmG [Spirochaetaceae bacterium]|nr:16S rRNA (guanine(527)-N(7))-methyltransferase RsmG [Spirochaetaceae bacterium]